MSIHPALFSSNRMDWCTPQDFFDRLDAEFHFALDAARTPSAPAPFPSMIVIYRKKQEKQQ